MAPSIEAQPVTAKLTHAAIFLVAAMNADPRGDAALRALCADMASLLRGIGFRQPDRRLSCVIGFGSAAWDRLFGQPRPANLHPFRELRGEHHAPSTPGDLLFHIRATHMDLCFELATEIMSRIGEFVTVADEVHGFKYFDERDLLGFVDGTENPVGQDASSATLIGEEDPVFAGGSYVIVQKYLHDLKAWNTVPVEQQERIIGRRKLSDVELAEADKPPYAHNVLTNIEENGEQLQIVRDNMPFGEVGKGEFGTYFIGYARAVAHRADAGQHVHRQPAGQLRPPAGFQQGGDGGAVLRAVSDVPGQSVAAPTSSFPPLAKHRHRAHRNTRASTAAASPHPPRGSPLAGTPRSRGGPSRTSPVACARSARH